VPDEFHLPGDICWDFNEDVDDVTLHIYMSVASVVERLARLELNSNNAIKVVTLQILNIVFFKFHHKRVDTGNKL